MKIDKARVCMCVVCYCALCGVRDGVMIVVRCIACLFFFFGFIEIEWLKNNTNCVCKREREKETKNIEHCANTNSTLNS